MQGARPIYIYRLAPCTENCSQRIYKIFSIKYLEHVHIFSTFEPKKHKGVFRAAVSTYTLKILCCGYNLATQKRRKFIKDYDTRRYKEYSFSSLSANKGVNQRVMRFTPFITPEYQTVRKKFITARCQGFYSYVSFRTTRIRQPSTTTLLLLIVTKPPTHE